MLSYLSMIILKSSISCNVYFTLSPFLDVEYKELSDLSCIDNQHGNYSTILEAESSCSQDQFCQGVYVPYCNESKGARLCPKGIDYQHSDYGSCVYNKTGSLDK